MSFYENLEIPLTQLGEGFRYKSVTVLEVFYMLAAAQHTSLFRPFLFRV
jgi:hypothetical protein